MRIIKKSLLLAVLMTNVAFANLPQPSWECRPREQSEPNRPHPWMAVVTAFRPVDEDRCEFIKNELIEFTKKSWTRGKHEQRCVIYHFSNKREDLLCREVKRRLNKLSPLNPPSPIGTPPEEQKTEE